MNYLEFYFRMLATGRVLTYHVHIDENTFNVDFKIISEVPVDSHEQDNIAPNEGLVTFSSDAPYEKTCLVFDDFDFNCCSDYELVEFFKAVPVHAHKNCNIALGGVLGFADFVKENKL